MVASQHFKKPLITILTHKTAILYRQNWFQFLFVVKATTLKQQTSKLYPWIISTEVSFDIYDRPPTGLHVVAGSCA